jgi:2-phosphosulfolactate phosphatase
MAGTVVIDLFNDSIGRYSHGYAVVAIDVIRGTTTLITAASLGRTCFPVASIEEVEPLARRLDNPLLAGELGGNMPYGFDLNNSPTQVIQIADVSRPMIVLSTSGTRLVCSGAKADALYVACLRNVTAQARSLIGRHSRIALLGAATRDEFRDEDQLCAARIAALLVDAGYESEDATTARLLSDWRDEPVERIAGGKSAEYLRTTGQLDDLEFILTHVDDLETAFTLERGRVVADDGGVGGGEL